MKLEIKDHNAAMLHDALGISDERSDELSQNLDGIVESYSKHGNMISVIEEIAAFCNNDEELIYALANHFNWLSFKNFGHKLL